MMSKLLPPMMIRRNRREMMLAMTIRKMKMLRLSPSKPSLSKQETTTRKTMTKLAKVLLLMPMTKRKMTMQRPNQ